MIAYLLESISHGGLELFGALRVGLFHFLIARVQLGPLLHDFVDLRSVLLVQTLLGLLEVLVLMRQVGLLVVRIL